MASYVKQLLKYQETDEKIVRLEMEANNSPERKSYVQAKNFLMKATEKLDQLESKAIQMNALMEKLQANYEEIAETLKDFENLDELVESGADISFYKKSATKIGDNLKNLKTQISKLAASVKEADEEYKNLKRKTITIQRQYNGEISEAYKKMIAEKQKKTEALKAELKTLAVDIDPEVLKRYEVKRSERIFPIICALKGDRCSKCGMELSLVGKENIATKGVIECENCHRFLYKE